ncbi:MAG: hypothetical protein ABIJ47_13710 [Candidatus Bathyarchaeota archaeon]
MREVTHDRPRIEIDTRIRIRRRGLAIVESEKGILVVSGSGNRYSFLVVGLEEVRVGEMPRFENY